MTKINSKLQETMIKYLVKNKMTVDGAIKILGRTMSSMCILFGSDFHVGSLYALCSPNPEREDGLQIKQTKHQKAVPPAKKKSYLGKTKRAKENALMHPKDRRTCISERKWCPC